MKLRDIDTGQAMKELKQDVNYGTGTVRVVLQFPEEPRDAAFIQKEVRAILVSELQEQMKNLRSGCR